MVGGDDDDDSYVPTATVGALAQYVARIAKEGGRSGVSGMEIARVVD